MAGHPTFSNKDRTRPQCGSQRRRSREDVYKLLKPVIKDIKFEDVSLLLEELRSKGWLYMNMCGQVKRRVFCSKNPSQYVKEKSKIIASIKQSLRKYEKNNQSVIAREA